MQVVFYIKWNVCNEGSQEVRAVCESFFVRDLAEPNNEKLNEAKNDVMKGIYETYYKDRLKLLKEGYKLQYAKDVELVSFCVVP